MLLLPDSCRNGVSTTLLPRSESGWPPLLQLELTNIEDMSTALLMVTTQVRTSDVPEYNGSAPSCEMDTEGGGTA